MEFEVQMYAIIENNGKVLALLKKSTDGFSADKWCLPGGKMNFGEDAIDCLKRVVKEVSNLDIDVLTPIDVSVDVDENKKKQIVAITYICEFKAGQPKVTKEYKECKWLDPKKIPELEELDWVAEKAIYPYIEFISV
ncbi:MAG: NUDIX domain-containing protein [Candidatus Aenigmarchaeota archaeon]|nr:NUDIX domain-containing protein [Candidatus Aenigmarchaeota archaeon]MCX8179369.1 NUDIX domain-containing protein [Candidatus Aenigmarchaeota archaeon]